MPGINEIERDLGTHYYRVYQVLRELNIQFPGRRGWSEQEYPEIRDRIRVRLQDGTWTRRRVRSPAAREPQTPSSVPTITVGADPEFEVWRGEEFVPASQFFRGLGTQVGTDAVSSIGELRPSFGTPDTVMESLRGLLQQVKDMLPQGYTIGAGAGRRVPLGGHIHIGGAGASPSITLLMALDKFIGRPLNRRANNRLRNHYGHPGQWRVQPHGWEYRSPCSWISHPDLARGALNIAHFLSAQNDELLGTLTDRSVLYRILGPLAEVARKFYQTLRGIERIERVQVFLAWGIEEPTTPGPEPRYEVGVSFDENLEQVRAWGLRSRLQNLIIRGAREARAPGEAVIFVPRELAEMSLAIPVRRWEHSGVGLSPAARQLPESELRPVLEAVLECFNVRLGRMDW